MAKAARRNTTNQITPADPIFAAIATHKRLERRWLEMTRKRDEAGASGPSEREVECASEESLAAHVRGDLRNPERLAAQAVQPNLATHLLVQ